MEYGTRVLRGPDWASDDADGGEGHLGTIISVGGEATCEVLWDNGNKTMCRIGKNGKHDLFVFDSGPTGIQHIGTSCDGCGTPNIQGTRWSCDVCNTSNLCNVCYGDMKHDITHKFMRYDTPTSDGVQVLPRCSGLRIQAMGIFPNAVVTKNGVNSESKMDVDEDVTGRVVDVEDDVSGTTARSWVRVEWETGHISLHRAGHEGKIDVKCIKEYPWTFYYRNHLSVLRPGLETMPVTGSESKPRLFIAGDRVCVKVSAKKLMELQSCVDSGDQNLKAILPKFGTVRGYTQSGHVVVAYSGQRMIICEEALKKVPLLTVGDTVRMLTNREEVKALQEYHGHYVEAMENVLGKVGVVKKISENGDVVIEFGRTTWVFNPGCCVLAPGQQVDVIDGPSAHHLLNLQEMMEVRDDLEFNVLNTVLDGEVVSDAGLLEKVEGMFDAFEKGNFSLCLMILRLDARLKRIVHHGANLLTLACINGNKSFVCQLLDEGMDINLPAVGGISPLLHTVLTDNIDIAKLLIEKGCDVNKPGKLNATPLHLCATMRKTDIARVICKADVNPNAKDMGENTPAHLCIVTGEIDILNAILSSKSCHKVDPTIVNGAGFTILHQAALAGNSEAVDSIVSHFPEAVDLLTPDSMFTALHIAANNNHVKCARTLIDKGKANVNARNRNGWTPLHLACVRLFDATVACLLQKGPDVNAQDEEGYTPLHFTVSHPGMSSRTEVLGLNEPGHGEDEPRIQLACKLIQNGADVNIKNSKNQTSIDAAQSETIKNAITMFLRSGSVASSSNSGTSTFSSAPKLTLPCSNCLTTPVDIKVRPCGHKFLCKICFEVVKHCPYCKNLVTGFEFIE